ncbi:S-layer homology domain-containing protein [Sphaerothrix gracilis]|uniref:S-layer homology domain-containing protein n=1 Tax=Sphaerothrix gracilis TaxID=3151835 RepID=UPI0031FC7542
MSATIIYVSSTQGSDRATGSFSQPLKSITQALRQVSAGDVIKLLPGRYSVETGEQFPLVIPQQVTLLGDEANQGAQTVISGGGYYNSPTFRQQNTTLQLAENVQIRGLSITNPSERGTGLWIESTGPLVARCQLIRCRRDGILITGNGKPLILDNLLVENGASGISVLRNSKGEIRRNLFRNTGYALAISDEAAPLVAENRFLDNRSGIVVSRTARPVLRRNQIDNSQEDGIAVLDQAQPDLGQPQDEGANVVRLSRQADLRYEGRSPLVSVGNQFSLSRVQGRVALAASQIPAAIAVPAVLLGQVEPVAEPIKLEEPPESPRPVGSSRFADLLGHWAGEFVDQLAARSLIRGFPDGTFRPNQQVTRAEFAALVTASFNTGSSGTQTRFSDVSTRFWARQAIYQAQAQGFISGFPDGTFRPNQPLTRIQAIVALANGLKLGQANANQLIIYRDRAQIPSYAVDALAAATQHRLVVNYPEPLELQPLTAISRAEIAALVHQGLVIQGRLPALESAYIVRPNTELPLFSDTESHWAANFIRALANQDLINGFADGSFQPNRPMTRAQYAALLAKSFELTPRRPATQFRDVAPNSWAAIAIQQAYRGGFLSGFPDQTFGPSQNILRLQLWLSLISGLNLLDQGAVNLSRLDFYQDEAAIPAYARPAVAKATELQLVVNYPNLRALNPNSVATRAEVCATVYQTLVALQRLTPLTSAYVVT